MISGERNIPISAHVTPAVKQALKDECDSREMTMSHFISDAIEEKLKREGVLIVAPASKEDEPPLPFDDDDEGVRHESDN